MNSIRRNHFTTIIGLVAVALTGTVTSIGARPAVASEPGSNQASEERTADRGIVGVWRVEVQSYDCRTNAPLGAPFSSVLTFNLGGTMSGSTTNPAFATGQRGIDQGTWSREGRNAYRAKDVTLLFFTTAPNPPSSPGFQAGFQILSQTIMLSESSDHFTSRATTEFFDLGGNSYRQGCATALAERFE